MRRQHLRFGHGFRVAFGDKHSQAAQVTVGPGEAEGGPDNHHRGADQWLFVVSGAGEAVVEGERVELRARSAPPAGGIGTDHRESAVAIFAPRRTTGGSGLSG